jgi:hypothetical protein
VNENETDTMFRKCRRLLSLVAPLGMLAILPDLWKVMSPVLHLGFDWVTEHPVSIVPVSFYLAAVMVKSYLASLRACLTVRAFFRYAGLRENPVRIIILSGLMCVYGSVVLMVLLVPIMIHEGRQFWEPYPWWSIAKKMKRDMEREMKNDWLLRTMVRWQGKR